MSIRFPRWLVALVAAVFVGLAPSVSQASEGTKFAVIDLARAIADTEDGIRMKAELQELYDARQLEYDAKEKAVADAKAEYDALAKEGKTKDSALRKKYAALAIEKEMRSRGLDADFRATGQTGIFISGRGVAVDSVVADFVSGAAEWLSPDAAPSHWDVIEGQGSLFHPAYAGVTLGLVHGSQPDVLVLCHDLARREIADFPGFPIASQVPSARGVSRSTSASPVPVGRVPRRRA